MTDGSWEEACIAWECPNKRAFLAPFCIPHILDAWRYIEARPDLKPTVPVAVIRKARTAARPKAPTRCLVYYAQVGDRIKIGISTQVAERMAALGARWPDDVLAVEWGDRTLEAALHERFSEHRHYAGSGSSELFTAAAEIMAHIESVREANGDPRGFAQEQDRLVTDWLQKRRQEAIEQGATLPP